MKVRTEGNRIVAIGKNLAEFNAIDTGIFVCPEIVFEYLRRVLKDDDCSLADSVRLMAEEGNALAVDIGGAWWQDVDTPEMLVARRAGSSRLGGLRAPSTRCLGLLVRQHSQHSCHRDWGALDPPICATPRRESPPSPKAADAE